MKNVFAHTDAGHDYPAFVSINKDDDGRYRVTVRSAGNNGTSLGEIHVSLETMERMAADVLAAVSGEPAADQCCGKCEKPADPVTATVDVQGYEADPDALRFAIDDPAQRLQTADMVINALVQAAGGEVIATPEICEKALGHQIESEVSEDRSTFTFRAVPVPPQVAQ